MSTTQLQAKGGEKWSFKLDPLTVINLNAIPDMLDRTIGVRPSYAAIVRRAIRLYSQHLDELKSARKLLDEKQELLIAAGRL
jgi:hypothetical protein